MTDDEFRVEIFGDEVDPALAKEAERFVDVLWGPGVDSTTRLNEMLGMVWKERPEIFWMVFHVIWSSCDDTWDDTRNLLIHLRRFHSRLSGPDMLHGGDRMFYATLPDRVTIYRGCSRQRVRGVSWTTDEETALRFARGHRGIEVPDPVLAAAIVPKAAIFSALQERKEYEVLIDPRRLSSLRVTRIS